MTVDKFKKEFPENNINNTNNNYNNSDIDNSSWEGAQYVEKISEFAKQKTRERFNPAKEKRVGIVKKSFINDKQHLEVPDYYNTVQPQQFTDVETIVPSETTGELWKNFKS